MTAPDPHVLAPGLAPTPFSAAEIRAGCPAGRVSIVRTPDGLTAIRFAEGDDDGAWIEDTPLDETGKPSGPVERERSTWLELQEHAAFPVEHTRIDRCELLGPLEQRRCLRYTVRRGEATLVFWFAVDLPGMPIRVERTEGGVTRTTLEVIRVGF
ncbi:hypothetical protein [Leifsonia shinshuensis]|uniref:Uncharacterized protein n=1 Tax=Leifsonia shinshuensis TaxID=150026 RepID=A0A7G6YDB9_9MICO|nr:hypothetical protein [Leifsonia shinshuensis]QNE36484.1 hypothetical protein F1C12_16100 [Leifsonia shinshuensis]